MDEFYILLLMVLAVAVAIAFHRRSERLKTDIRHLQEGERNYAAILQSLVQRVHALEQGRPVAPPLAPSAVQRPPEPDSPAQATPPEPVFEPVRSTSMDWEGTVGGNLLNKAGALILVVGIALFLGYSLTMLGPSGKIAIGLAIGTSMLVSGLLLERREGYSTFGRGFIGGGWATIYFTVYAAHALEASRVINSPLLGCVLLLCVAVSMILHSIRYRSEAVTALAYVIGFVSLAASPLTSFTVVATLLLALSILAISFRASWYKLGLAGIALSYSTFLSRYDSAIYSQPGLLNAQSMLWIYWISFECSDLLQRHRGNAPVPLAALAFWANAFFFVIGAAVHGEHMAVKDWAPVWMLVAMAFFASAAVRYRIVQRSGSFFAELFEGGFGSAITLSAASACAAITHRYGGAMATLLLLLVVEALVAAGMLLQLQFLRTLGRAFQLVPFLHWFDADYSQRVQVTVAGLRLYQFSLTALALVAAYILNRVWTRAGWIYGAASSVLLGIVIHEEVQQDWGTVVWAFLACGVAVLGWYLDKRELRWNGYFLIAATVLRTFAINLGHDVPATRIATVGLIALILYASVHLMRRPEVESLDRGARGAMATAASIIVFSLLNEEVEGGILTVAWGLQGAGLLAAGFMVRDKLYRVSGLLLFLLCVVKLFFFDLNELKTLNRILSFIVLGLLLLAASWVYTRYRDQLRKLL